MLSKAVHNYRALWDNKTYITSQSYNWINLLLLYVPPLPYQIIMSFVGLLSFPFFMLLQVCVFFSFPFSFIPWLSGSFSFVSLLQRALRDYKPLVNHCRIFLLHWSASWVFIVHRIWLMSPPKVLCTLKKKVAQCYSRFSISFYILFHNIRCYQIQRTESKAPEQGQSIDHFKKWQQYKSKLTEILKHIWMPLCE